MIVKSAFAKIVSISMLVLDWRERLTGGMLMANSWYGVVRTDITRKFGVGFGRSAVLDRSEWLERGRALGCQGSRAHWCGSVSVFSLVEGVILLSRLNISSGD